MGLVTSPVSVPVEMPPDAVSEIDGSNAARAAARFALAPSRLASAVTTSGLRVSNSEASPGATLGASIDVRSRAAHVEPFGRTSEENGQRRARLQFLLLELRNLRLLARDRLTLLRQFERRGRAVAHARVGDHQHGLRVLEIQPCDFDPLAQREQLEIRRRGRGGRGQRHRLAVRARRPVRGLCRRKQAPVAAPEIELVARAQRNACGRAAGGAQIAYRRRSRRSATAPSPPRARARRPAMMRVSAAARSRFPLCADVIRPSSSSLPNPRHQSGVGQIGAAAATGCSNAIGTSDDASCGTGLVVAQALSASAQTPARRTLFANMECLMDTQARSFVGAHSFARATTGSSFAALRAGA